MIITPICRPPLTINDMKNFVKAIDKVANSANLLKKSVKRFLLHSSEAGMAAQIYAIKNLVKNKSLILDFSIFDDAQFLVKEPFRSLTKHHELFNMWI